MKLSSLPLSILLVLLLFSVAVFAEAALVYRWVDKKGVTHFANVVPEAYGDVAKPFKHSAANPSPAEHQRAVERAKKQRMKASQALSTVLADNPSTSTTPSKESQDMKKGPEKAPPLKRRTARLGRDYFKRVGNALPHIE